MYYQPIVAKAENLDHISDNNGGKKQTNKKKERKPNLLQFADLAVRTQVWTASSSCYKIAIINLMKQKRKILGSCCIRTLHQNDNI